MVSPNANRLGDLLTRISDAGRALMTQPDAPDMAALAEALLSGRGEATGLAIARTILDRYRDMPMDERAKFFADMRDRFGVDRAAMDRALASWRGAEGGDPRVLHQASEPRSFELIRRLNRAPGGTRDLVAMRADLLGLCGSEPGLARLDTDFRHLFGSWFNPGFLELRRIDWSTPAAVLEKIILYEAVHQITGWDDLRRRVAAPDRRLYAFFHPALVDDPLVFVEVALTEEMPDAIGPILAEKRDPLPPEDARTAVFYSISNCQPGLRGISFGSFLIKQVVEALRTEFSGLSTFVTLSPVPGLRAWAEGEADGLGERDRETLRALDASGSGPRARELAARYLIEARHDRGGARDPVARFHLGNGARLERINAEADMSARGRAGSWGVMVNYLYDLETIEKNHETYTGTGEVIAAPSVRRLLRNR